MVTIKIPSLWRWACQDQPTVAVPPGHLSEALKMLIELYPQLKIYLLVETGEVNPALNFFVNQEHIRYRGGMQADVENGDEIYIVPPISGGNT